ncbi:MAG: helix-turn-helix domain-containing protein [Erythrobacter sp.]|nr:helix-turn-helix domain-containing protein [Erythrobacter sp.]
MRIGELARATGVKTETIRYYEREGILAAPPRTQANYRDYGPNETSRLHFIRRARNLGFSMAQVRELLDLAGDKSQSCAEVDVLTRTHLFEVDRKIAELKSLRTELSRMLENCEQGAIGDCLIVEALAQQPKEVAP